MKKFIVVVFFLFFPCCINAYSDETTVSGLELNKSSYSDIEVYMDSLNKIYIPVKQTAKILKIPFKENHSAKEISFLTPNGQEALISKKGVYLNNVLINSQLRFKKDGIIETDEFFIDANTASKIFDSDIAIDSVSLCVSITSKYLESSEKTETPENLTVQKHAVVPKEKGKFSFDTFEINNSMMNDSTKQVYLNASQNSVMFNNNTRMSLKGKLYEGDYDLKFNTNNYADRFFSFGGLSFTYRNKLKDYYYELGQVSGLRDPYNSIGTMLIGAQISDYNQYEKKQQAQEQVEFLKKGDSRNRLFAGISGYNNRLFSSNGYIYQMTSKKFVAGGNRQYGLSNNMKLDTKIIYDKILQQNENALFISAFNNDYSILSSGVYRNPNTMEGVSIINTLNLYRNKYYSLNALAAASLMKDFNYDKNHYNPGYSLSLENVFDYKNTKLKLRLYQQSPDYYVAGSDSGFICDRLGAEATAAFAKENINANLRYTRYYSNLDSKYLGGLTSFDEAYFNAGAKIFGNARMRFNGNIRYGENSIGHNLNYYYNLNISKNIKQNLSVEAGHTGNAYDTQYSSNYNTTNGFNSSYNSAYANLNYRLPKNKGTIKLGHDTVSYESNGAKNDYNMIRVNYQFPEFKRLLLGFGVGYKYQGLDDGCTYSAAIGYRTRTGMIISLNYQYNTAMGYVFNNMYIPSNARHSINLTVNDTFVFTDNGLQSIGTASANQGFVEVVTFIDKNNNGIFDRKDIKVSNVPIKVSWKSGPIRTKRNGFCDLQSVDKGYYNVSLDADNMHANLSAQKSSDEYIYVEPKKTTRVEFPLKSSVGNIRGKLYISDDFDRQMNITDFIVSLYDENGAEVAYSTVDDTGSYYFSGISPGHYKIMLDKNFINDYSLIPDEQYGEILVNIPYVYKKFVELEDQNLIYKCL